MQVNSNFNVEKNLSMIFTDAINLHVSDIHIMPENKQIYIKFRVDGKFVNYKTLGIEYLEVIM